MNIYVLIALLGASVIFISAYLLSLLSIYKKEKNAFINFRNTFLYEAANKYRVVNGFLYVALASTLVLLILCAAKNVSVMSVAIAVLYAFFSFSLGASSLIDFRFLKEHLYIDLGMLISSFAITGLEAFHAFSKYRLFDYKPISLLIAFIISLILLLVIAFFIFNPKLFDLKNKVEGEKETRKDHILLALLEWSMILMSVIISVPMILVFSVL